MSFDTRIHSEKKGSSKQQTRPTNRAPGTHIEADAPGHDDDLVRGDLQHAQLRLEAQGAVERGVVVVVVGCGGGMGRAVCVCGLGWRR